MIWQLRSADAEDASGVAALHRRSKQAAMPWLPDLHTPTEDLAYFTGEIPSSVGWVAIDDDDAIVGFALSREGWLNHLYIAPDAQGIGIGSALLAEAVASIGPGIRLWAFQRNRPALSFYANHGFVEVKRTDGQDNDEKEPDVLLQRG